MAKTKITERCYTSQHLTPQEHGLLDVCMRLTSGGKNTLYFDGRKMAARFSRISKSSIYRTVGTLVSSGWLKPLNGGGKKRRNGTEQYEATQYQVMSHEQWITKHGTEECCQGRQVEPVPSTGTEPVPSTGTLSPKYGNGQSQDGSEPVPSTGHNSVAHSSITSSSMKENSMYSLSNSIGSRLASAGKRSKEEKIQTTQEDPEDACVRPVPSTGMEGAQ
jgi:Fe2+ or Zn2+ uptake regulation protein